jgi:peptidoglycan/xylan/chitin deacetylase (PgdA/CDA1 family)
MIAPAIEIKVKVPDPRAEYALRFLFTAVGYPFRIVREWTDPVLRVAYSGGVVDADVRLPLMSSARGRLEVRVVEEISLLYRTSEPVPCAFAAEGSVGFDLVGVVYDTLSRREEVDLQHALLPEVRFEGYQSDLYDLGLLARPVLNQYVTALGLLLERALAVSQRRLDRLPVWKEDRSFAVALTHDVDRIRYFSLREAWVRLSRVTNGEIARRARFETLLGAFVQAVRTANAVTSKTDPFWNFERWLRVEQRYGFRSTFFVAAMTSRGGLGDPTYRMADTLQFHGRLLTLEQMLRYFVENGWEVGLHPSVRTCDDAELLAAEKAQLERATRAPVNGLRQHRLMFHVPQTWRVQQRTGFAYDSTLGFNTRLGFRASVALPFCPFNPDAGHAFNLLELPLSMQDGVLLEEEATSLSKMLERAERQLDEVERANGLAVLLWHPNYASDDSFPGWFAAYEAILDRLSQRRAFVGTAAEIAEWWLNRSQRVDLTQ